MPPKKVVRRKNTSDSHGSSILDPYLKSILEILPGEEKRFICNICTQNQPINKDGLKNAVTGHIYWLRMHLETKSHKDFTPSSEKLLLEEAIQSIQKKVETNNCSQLKKEESSEKEKDVPKQEDYPLSETNEAKLYLDIANFVITNHLPFEAGPEVLKFGKYISSNYHKDLISRTHLSSTALTKIIRKSIGDCLRKRIVMDLSETPYSLLIDASSEIFGGKYLALMVRYLKMEEEGIETKLFSIVELGASSTGEVFYNIINEEVLNLESNMKANFFAISTDGGSNMNSSKGNQVETSGQGVVNRLTKDNPSLIFVGDMCHLFNLVVEEALQQFPAYVLQFVKKICAYFNTGQRSSKLREIQLNAGIKEPLEVLSYKSIRWESLFHCIERILKLWLYIKLCLDETDSFLKGDINDPEYELYGYLLYVFLHKLTRYIVVFQKSNLLFDQVIDKMREAYIIFSQMLLKKKFQENEFENLWSIPFEEEENVICKERLLTDKEFHDLLNERYPKIVELIQAVKHSHLKNQGIEKQFYGHARDIILQTIIVLKKRLPYENKILNQSLVVYLKQVYSIDLWRQLAKELPNIITQESEILFMDELDSFNLRYKNIVQDHKNSGVSIIRRWNILKSDFPTIYKLARALLSIPYSTSSVESLFSEFKAFKTPYRNRLNVQNLEASLLAEQYFRSENPRILPEMVSNYFNIWKKEEAKSNESEKKKKSESDLNELNKNESICEVSSFPEIQPPNNMVNLMSSMMAMFDYFTKINSSKSELKLSPSNSKGKRKALEDLNVESEKKSKLTGVEANKISPDKEIKIVLEKQEQELNEKPNN